LWERRSRDSDVASVITVDEVTAELETRRASGVSWRASDSDEDEDDEGREDGLVQVDPAEDDEIESDFDDDMSDDDEFETDDIDEEPGTAKPEGESLAVLTGRTGSPF
jgi:mitogen-activated protein kinase kinase kinase